MPRSILPAEGPWGCRVEGAYAWEGVGKAETLTGSVGEATTGSAGTAEVGRGVGICRRNPPHLWPSSKGVRSTGVGVEEVGVGGEGSVVVVAEAVVVVAEAVVVVEGAAVVVEGALVVVAERRRKKRQPDIAARRPNQETVGGRPRKR